MADASNPAASKRRFLLLLPQTAYYTGLGDALGRALSQLGVETAINSGLNMPPLLHTKLGLGNPEGRDTERLERGVRDLRPTDVLAINLPRRLLPLPAETTYHCWIQDPYESEVEDRKCGDHVWMFIRHWVDWWGGKYLPPATDYGRYLDATRPFAADVSVTGAMPRGMMVFPDPQVNLKIQKISGTVMQELMRRPVLFCDRNYAEKLLAHAQEETGVEMPIGLRPLVLRHIQLGLFRQVQRKRLMDALIPICTRRGWTLRVAGPEWDLHPPYRRYTVGTLQPGEEMARFYQTTRVNLHTHGDSNVHPRVLECLASGSFVLSQAHPTDEQPGGLRSILSPRAAPTFTDAADLEAKLELYLAHEEGRQAAIAEGGEAIRSQHTFRQRAETLIAAVS